MQEDEFVTDRRDGERRQGEREGWGSVTFMNKKSSNSSVRIKLFASFAGGHYVIRWSGSVDGCLHPADLWEIYMDCHPRMFDLQERRRQEERPS